MTDYGLGWVPDPADERDLEWRAVHRAAMVLPRRHIITRRGPVLNQGGYPACVGYSCASLQMTMQWRDHQRFFRFDPLELYQRCKELDGYPGEDGTTIRVAMAIMARRGILAHAETGKLSADTMFPISAYLRLTSLQQIKEALYTAGPVVFGIEVDPGIKQPVRRDGLVHPVVPDPAGEPVGGHAMCAVGWDDTTGLLIKNSWSRGWGHNGLAWLPWSHFGHYTGWDAWRTTDVPDDVLAALLGTGG